MKGSARRGQAWTPLLGLLVALPSVAEPDVQGAAALIAPPVVVERATSAFGTSFVVDHKGLRYLRSGTPDGPDQTVIALDEPARLVMPYLRPVALAVASRTPPDRALLVGLGGGGFVHYLRRRYPETQIDPVRNAR